MLAFIVIADICTPDSGGAERALLARAFVSSVLGIRAGRRQCCW
jgi:hypothetical protein